MNLRLSDWASIAELVSAIAVVTTLIFLIVGIRENTAITRVSVYGDLLQELSQTDILSMQDVGFARVVETFFEGTTDTLDESERRSAIAYVLFIFRNYERAYFSQEYDIIGDEEWSRFERLICANSRRALVMGMELTEAEFLTDSFKEYIQAKCAGTSE